MRYSNGLSKNLCFNQWGYQIIYALVDGGYQSVYGLINVAKQWVVTRWTPGASFANMV